MKISNLCNVRPGAPVTILKIDGGRGVHSHLAGMGLQPGFQLNVIEPPQGGGAMLIRIGSSRFMLGYGMAEKITVRQS